VSRRLGIPEERISVGMSRMGGGFGRRLRTDYAEEAAVVSSLVEAPVLLLFSREDDMSAGIYRPAGRYDYRAGLDEDGTLVGWHLRSAAVNTRNGTRENNFPAGAVDNFRVDFNPLESAITTGAWRAPNHNFVAFAEESFVDEIAHAGGKDPVAYRLELLDRASKRPVGDVQYDPRRYASVIRKVADMAGWGQARGEGVFQGFGAHFSFGTYVAEIADVSVEAGKIRVHRVYCAVDCGTVVNLSGAEQQIEGGIIDGLGHALYGELTFEDGAPSARNFDRYDLIRIDDAPEINVAFLPSDERPTGLGEPGLPPIAAAVGNAVFAATGIRVRTLPFSHADLG
jgi:isoquinoline 1-oxidoreductase beta subunit